MINVYDYKAPDVVIERSMKELDVDFIGYKIIEKRLFDYFVTIKEYSSFEMIDADADIIWHNYILNTKSYADFCHRYFNMFIHHEPYLVDGVLSEEEIENLALSVVNAVKNYRLNLRLEKFDEGHYLFNENFFNKIRNYI